MNDFEQLRLRQQQRQRALQRIIDDGCWLVGHAPGTLRWLSTRRDLIEYVQTVWLAGRLRDDRGYLLSRAAIARKAFAAVGQQVPSYIRHVAAALEQRRGPQLSLVERYIAMEEKKDIIKNFLAL